MTMHRLLVGISLIFLVTAATWVDAENIGTTFTYQGVLSDAGAPEEGTFDFRVFLYNADSGGSQVGSTALVAGVLVADGRVALDLDFGDVFDGTALWLEIHLRESGTATYTPLWPRQPLTATPFANHATSAEWAANATSALSADNATQLAGQGPAYYLAWSNLTGLPDGLDDGDDDTLADLNCGDNEILRWTGTAWNCSSEDSGWSSTYVVGPVGSAVENGTALRAAVLALPTATETAQILVHLEPGTYDLGADSLPLYDWVSLEGAGRAQTIVTSGVDGDYATINLGMDSQLRSLTVLNTSAGTYSYAVRADNRSEVLDVTTISDGNGSRSRGISAVGLATTIENTYSEVLAGSADHSCYAIWGTDLTLRRVETVTSGSAGLLVAVTSLGTGNFIAEGLTITATGTSTPVTGLWVTNPDIRLTNVTVEAASDTTSATAIYSPSLQSRGLNLDNVTATAAGGSGTSYGLRAWDLDSPSFFSRVSLTGDPTGLFLSSGTARVTIRDSQFSGSDYGIVIGATTGPVDISDSAIEGGLFALNNGGSGLVTIASTQLANGTTGNPRTCAGVWDENHTFFSDTCP